MRNKWAKKVKPGKVDTQEVLTPLLTLSTMGLFSYVCSHCCPSLQALPVCCPRLHLCTNLKCLTNLAAPQVIQGGDIRSANFALSPSHLWGSVSSPQF